MKKSIQIFPFLLAALLFFTHCEKETVDTRTAAEQQLLNIKNGEAIEEECVVVQTLWAGAGQNNTENGTDVGTVVATLVGDNLLVTYDITFPWVLTEAHLWVGNDLNDVPGNAAPGRFPFKANLDFESGVAFTVNLEELGLNPGDMIYVAAHGVVVGLDGDVTFETLLPDAVEYSVIYFKNFAANGIPTPPQSYFQIEVSEGFLSGPHKGWCVDTSTPITQETLLNGVAYSSYGDFPDDIFDKAENLPAVNWLINNIFIGEQSDGGFGAFTMGDIQRAIWILLEDDPNLNVPGGVGASNADRVNEIVERALLLSDGFVPQCDDLLAIILVSPNQQTTIIEFPFLCGGGSETIWGFGEHTFIDNGIAQKWGWAFEVGCYANSDDNGEEANDDEEENENGNGNGNGNGRGKRK